MPPKDQLTILIAPLDWGLGHATRCIPIIRHSLSLGHKVIIASTGRSLALLQKEFPTLPCVDVPAYDISYQEKGSFIVKILGQLGKIFSGIRREHRVTKELVAAHGIDLIISDNRYGFYHKQVPSIIITHQMMVKIPQFKLAEPFVYLWLQSQHIRFNKIWIPDVKGEPNISGDLSHAYPVMRRTTYIGVLSRFPVHADTPVKKDQVLAIISGPEPQRTLFEDRIVKQAAQLPYSFIVVRGLSEQQQDEMVAPNIRMISHLPGDALYTLIQESSLIISRGGYTTLMDLASLNKRCIFVPTPGQTEQEYLVKALGKKGLVVSGQQNNFDLARSLEQAENTNGFFIPSPVNTFQSALEAVIAEVQNSKV